MIHNWLKFRAALLILLTIFCPGYVSVAQTNNFESPYFPKPNIRSPNFPVPAVGDCWTDYNCSGRRTATTYDGCVTYGGRSWENAYAECHSIKGR